jgi:ABC-type glycerol-3-phosphate transport system substrate-binding protein
MRRAALFLAVIQVAALVAAGVGSAATRSTSAVSGSISFDGVWTGQEANHFQAVINAFQKRYAGVKVNYKPVGDNLPTVLSTAVAGGRPPDMADIAQPGLVKQFVDKGALKPITFARSVLAANFSPSWLKLATFKGQLYGLVFKASNKSTVWYNVHAFENAGVTPPSTWSQLLRDAKTIKDSGIPPYSIGGADGWTLTDLFENIYLRQAGPAKYAQLSAHSIKWTDPSVTTALTTMRQVIGDSANIVGGTSGGLQDDFPTSVNNVFQNPPKGAIVFEGDFVPGVATVNAKPVTDYNEFAFPSINGSGPAVEIGGDTIVAFRDTPAIRAFVKFLGTSQAAAAWARFGGFATGNRKMSPSVYPDAITRKTASPISQAKNIVFDMSDQQPGAFGATVGQGEWGLFEKFLGNPSNVKGIQAQLEAAAAAAYKNGT